MQRPDINKLKELKAKVHFQGALSVVTDEDEDWFMDDERGGTLVDGAVYGQELSFSDCDYIAALHNANLIEYIEELERQLSTTK